jgi:hypothetical protein
VELSRRQFIKGLAAVGITATFPVSITEHPDFDPTKPYGGHYEFTTTAKVEIEDMLKLVLEDIDIFIPKKYHNKVKYKYTLPQISPSDPFARVGCFS